MKVPQERRPIIDSYSNALIKFTLTHYVDIMYGKITPEEMGDFCKSVGRKDPLNTALNWKADIDQAIASLSNRKQGWHPYEITSGEMIRRIAFTPGLLSSMQQDIVVICILKENTHYKNCNLQCKETNDTWVNGVKVQSLKSCANADIITRMRKFLNGQGRDGSGKFIKVMV